MAPRTAGGRTGAAIRSLPRSRTLPGRRSNPAPDPACGVGARIPRRTRPATLQRSRAGSAQRTRRPFTKLMCGERRRSLRLHTNRASSLASPPCVLAHSAHQCPKRVTRRHLPRSAWNSLRAFSLKSTQRWQKDARSAKRSFVRWRNVEVPLPGLTPRAPAPRLPAGNVVRVSPCG